MRWFWILCLAFATVFAHAKQSIAARIPQALSHVVPGGLQPGDNFHLLFVSRDVRDAQSADIRDYNEFVNTVADSAGIGPTTSGVQWFAVASTPVVDARDNAVVQAPVYNLQGELLASDFADMWDGALASAVNYDEHALAIIPFHHVWTGSRSDGTAYSGRELGQFATAEIGDLKRSDGGWIETSNASPLVRFHLYGLSESLVVVLEPSALAIQACIGISLVPAGRFLRRR